MKCNKCGYDDSGSGDMAHVCQRPSFRYGEHPTSFGLFNTKQEPVAGKWIVLSESVGKLKELGWNDEAIHKANTPQRTCEGCGKVAKP
jgi:hypothetical protein